MEQNIQPWRILEAGEEACSANTDWTSISDRGNSKHRGPEAGGMAGRPGSWKEARAVGRAVGNEGGCVMDRGRV